MVTPAASPSKPSSQLIAFAIPANQTIVIGKLNQPNLTMPMNGMEIKSILTPTFHAAAATANWAISRGKGGKLNKSSAKPIKKKAAPPIVTPQTSYSLAGGKIPNHPTPHTSSKAVRLPKKIATPPTRTTGVVCILRLFGLSTKPALSP